jgi:hypothetical protein
MPKGIYPRKLLKERFWDKVDKTKNCWEWKGTTRLGYGVIWRDKKWYPAHRLSWEMHCGDIPKKLFICHHCDNRKCVRPDHLFLGNQKDNMQDAFSKNRMVLPSVRAQGEKHGNVKLTEKQVLEIRKLYVPERFGYRKLAKKFGVAISTIKNIINKITWKHI